MLRPHIYAPSCTCGKIECSVQVSKNSASLAFTPDAASGRLLSFAKIIAAVPFRQAHRAPKCSAIIVFSSYIFPLKTELPPKGVDCNSLAIQSYVEIIFGNQHKTFWVIESQISEIAITSTELAGWFIVQDVLKILLLKVIKPRWS